MTKNEKLNLRVDFEDAICSYYGLSESDFDEVRANVAQNLDKDERKYLNSLVIELKARET